MVACHRRLRAADKTSDVVVMAEVADEASYVPHHPKKIAFLFAAMRKFAQRLRDAGWTVEYKKLDEDGSDSICGELLRCAEAHGAEEVIATEPGEFRLIEALQACPLKVDLLEAASLPRTRVRGLAAGRKQLRDGIFTAT